MLARPSCLASPDVYLAASPAQLAIAVLFAGFSDTADAPAPSIAITDLFQATAGALGALDGLKPQSSKWFEALGGSGLAPVRLAMNEGILFAEQRLCLWREATNSSSHFSIVLLRRGQSVLLTGDTSTYLG